MTYNRDLIISFDGNAEKICASRQVTPQPQLLHHAGQWEGDGKHSTLAHPGGNLDMGFVSLQNIERKSKPQPYPIPFLGKIWLE